MFELSIRDPLADLISECAVYCHVACCGMGAVDENAYTMLRWVRKVGESTARDALRQLDSAIEQVSSYEGVVVDNETFNDDWPHGAACAEYLSTWHRELNRALTFSVEGSPSAAERLREATHRGGSDFFLEVRRLTREAHLLVQSGDAAAWEIFSLIAKLDPNDRTIDSSVVWSREMLARRDRARD